MNQSETKSILKISKHLHELKLIAKQLNADSKKCSREEEVELAMVKVAIQRGSMEAAKVHAENSIRKKRESIDHLRMAARVDAAVARMQTAVYTEKVTQSIACAEKLMNKFNSSTETTRIMNLEKISILMRKIEKKF